MCYLNRTANTCSIWISNSDRLGCGSVQRSTWAGLNRANGLQLLGMLQDVTSTGVCFILSHCRAMLDMSPLLAKFWKARPTDKGWNPWMTWQEQRAPLLDAQTASKGHKRQWNPMHMIKRWCFVDMSYQHLPTKPLPNLEVTEMEAMCSTCLVLFFGADPFLFGLT